MRKFKQKNLIALMRKFSLGSCFTALFMVLSISACSDDDDDAAKTVFPEKQTVNCVSGDTKELSFNASADWQLSSSATWCRFVKDKHEDYSLSGTAGTQTVTLKITSEALAFDAPSVAHLTMMIGANKAIIADVVRDNMERELKIYDMKGNEIHEIEVGYDNYSSFQVKANFRFAATNRPEWLNIAGNAIVGSINEMVKGEVQVIDNPQYAKYEQRGELTFADEYGIKSYTFPVVYNGMNPEKIKILNANPWNWEVSLDGKTFTQTSSTGASASTTTSTYRNFLPYTVQALNDDVVPVYIQKVVEYGMTQMRIGEEDGVDWMELVDYHDGNFRLTVSESSEEREGYVVVLPRAVYEDHKSDLWSYLIKMNMETNEPEIEYTISQNNLLINFVQKEKKQVVDQAFKVTYTLDWVTRIELTCTKVTNEDITGKYPNVNEIYTLEWPADYVGGGVEINPLEGAVEDDWKYVLMYGSEDKSKDTNVVEPSAEVVTIYQAPRNAEYHLLIQKNDETIKVLIITPNYN